MMMIMAMSDDDDDCWCYHYHHNIVGMIMRITRLFIEEGGGGAGGGMEVGKREIIYLSLHCHHQNDLH